ncbi:MAG: ATP-binding cassette domain-containing protein [Clostridiales Family XIII bacterium]|jgi:D-methionine transport system ATP-binding protein|nr:ATP-binding cassette domain-containing protein [Clostridiales Family XIII bacterium]
MIELSHVMKTFQTAGGSLKAVDDVSVTIEKGEIFGFIGFSGAGKSTLLRCINLLEKPDSGKVIIDGEDFTKLSKRELRKQRQNIGMIFQHFNLLYNATTYENVAFPLEIAKVPKEERRKRVLRALDIVDLPEKADDYPSRLSGGQKQRIAIARAIVMRPKILLCDEPTSALDPQTTDTILKYLKRVNSELGVTVVLVTHEMEAARKICNRVFVMEEGHEVEMITLNDGVPESAEGDGPQSDIARYLFIGGEGI